MNRLSNFGTRPDRSGFWAAVGVALLAGCGGPGGGTVSDDLICRGEGVIVGGKVTFIKRHYDARGLTGRREILPVRYALVEMVLQVDGRVLGKAYTDQKGNYCVAARGVPPDFPTVYPRVATRTDPAQFDIAVVDSITSPAPNVYSRPGAPLNGTVPGVYDRDIAIPVVATLESGVLFSLSGAFNILDVAARGAEEAVQLAGRPPGGTLLLGWTPGTVFGAGSIGTYFVGDDPTRRADPNGGIAGIELSGGDGGSDPDSGDHDEFDDDIIFHEFGHFMAFRFSKPAEAGGIHYLNDNTQDIRLSWSEGWATFFSAAVRKSPVMVNTRGGDPGHPEHDFSYSFDLEKPHSALLTGVGTPLEEHGVYTTNEVAVSAMLWDLYDSGAEPGDRYALGLQGVWNVFVQLVNAPPHVSFETFATYFLDQLGPSQLPFLAETTQLRRVQLFPDQYENGSGDDSHTASPIEVGPGISGVPIEYISCHTLYPAGDVDFIRIQLDAPRRVTVETFNLSNGADTVVQFLEADGATVIEVDVDNDGTSDRLENDNAPMPENNPFTPTICGNRERAIPDAYYTAGVNNGRRLASVVSTKLATLPGGTYYAKVVSRATFNGGTGRNISAGVFGSYDLSITLQ